MTNPTPRSNSVTPTEKGCVTAPETTIDKAPKKRVKTKRKKKKVKFRFSSSDPTATFECSLDDDPFEACVSPHKVKVKKGKHTFAVRARTDAGVDQTPDDHSFKVKRKKRK